MVPHARTSNFLPEVAPTDLLRRRKFAVAVRIRLSEIGTYDSLWGCIDCHKLDQLCVEASANHTHRPYRVEGGTMRGFHNSSFDPPTLVVLEAAFDEAWLTLKSIGNTTVKPDELARSVLRLATEGERDPMRLHDGALEGLVPATAWREAS
jgi:hypothetical protein